MDSLVRGFSGCTNGFKFDHVSLPGYSDQNDANVFKFRGTPFVDDTVLDLYFPNDPNSRICESSPPKILVEHSTQDGFSDADLKNLNQALMDDDLEDKECMIPESALRAAEKPFYDILGEKYPSSPKQPFLYQNINYSDDMVTHCSNYRSGRCVNANSLAKSGLCCDLGKHSHVQNPPVDHAFLYDSLSLCPLRSSSETVDGLADSVVNAPLETQSVSHFEGGIEEPREFLTSGNYEILNLENNRLDPLRPKQKLLEVEANAEKDEGDISSSLLLERKNLHQEENYLEDKRSKKHLAACIEESVLLELFCKALLVNGGNDESTIYNLDEHLPNGVSKELQQNVQSKCSNGGANCTKKWVSKKKSVDMRTLLIQCAQAVADNDVRSANELLKQIRWHSSPFGDKHQRLSHCFAYSLESRLLGTGSPLYAALAAKNMSDVRILKAYKLFISTFPFMKTSNFFATQMILEVTNKANRVHIIHFGISHGFQWLPLVQHLSKRPGGPPKLHITGIDHPNPGFRPAARVEGTGYRLANYCERLNVPFEYNYLAQKWETIRIEDLKIEKDEVLIVVSLYQFRCLLDDTILENSPRDAVLNLIKRINPVIFIHGIENGTYNSPFLVLRFREALFHFSALFDMFEANVSREDPDRMVFERDIFGNEVLNVIACEGSERTERPETYKQWQARHLRAGFRQLPLNPEIMKKITAKVKLYYHKEFFVDENSQWMLQGWKGRAILALSCWKPA